MDTMVKEKDAAIQRATGFEAEAEELEKTAQKFEKEVSEIQRKIAKVEDQLDITISSTKETGERLEVADKESIDAELQGMNDFIRKNWKKSFWSFWNPPKISFRDFHLSFPDFRPSKFRDCYF